jgi:hypothetical protein
VFTPNDGTGSTSGQTISTAFPVDLAMSAYKTQGYVGLSNDRLRGISNANSAGTTPALQTSTTQSESAFSGTNPWFINAWNNSITRGSNGADPSGGIVTWLFRRAPGFFDEVCFGPTVTTAVPHNLAVVPELIIAKNRTGSDPWYVWQPSTSVRYGILNSTAAFSAPAGSWPATSTTFEPLTFGGNFVNYLFATLAGISKVGSYTGNGSSQNIECGFAAGARFFLVKATSTTGSWWVWDSARGITAGNDPALQLNSIAAEITTADAVDPYAAGITVNQEAICSINASGVSYVYLAIS